MFTFAIYQVREQLELSIQRREELQKEIYQMEEKLEEKKQLVFGLQKKSQKLEDALTNMKKLSSHRKTQLTKVTNEQVLGLPS